MGNLTTSTSLCQKTASHLTRVHHCGDHVECFHLCVNEPTSVSHLMRTLFDPGADTNTLYLDGICALTNYIICTKYSCLLCTRSTQVVLLEVWKNVQTSDSHRWCEQKIHRLLSENTSRMFCVNTTIQVAVNILWGSLQDAQSLDLLSELSIPWGRDTTDFPPAGWQKLEPSGSRWTETLRGGPALRPEHTQQDSLSCCAVCLNVGGIQSF